MNNSILDIIGKPVLNLYDCKIQGIVDSFWLEKDYKKIKWLSIFNEENQEEIFVDVKNIFCCKEDAVVIKNEDCIVKKEEIDFSLNCLNPIKHSIYNTKGKLVGTVKNIEFDDKFAVLFFCSETDKFTTKQVAKCGENIVIIQDKNVAIKIPQTKQKIENLSTQKNEQKVFALPYKDVLLPTQVITKNYNFLLGRKAIKNIYSQNNEIIIKKNTHITERHLEAARTNYKLRELAIWSE